MEIVSQCGLNHVRKSSASSQRPVFPTVSTDAKSLSTGDPYASPKQTYRQTDRQIDRQRAHVSAHHLRRDGLQCSPDSPIFFFAPRISHKTTSMLNHHSLRVLNRISRDFTATSRARYIYVKGSRPCHWSWGHVCVEMQCPELCLELVHSPLRLRSVWSVWQTGDRSRNTLPTWALWAFGHFAYA
jgi:hypothetical protein